MNEVMIRGLIGDDGFTRILVGLPDGFFKMSRSTQDALWKTVLDQINDGMTDINKLITYARLWVEMYPIVKTTIHRVISKL